MPKKIFQWQTITKILASNTFFGIIIAITIVQALWYALNFVPWINDEPKHFHTTQIYTQQVLPFFTEQPTAWDSAGQVIRDGSYLFYYLMSWPLRLLQFITPDHMVQLFGLRMTMLATFIAGLVYYRRAMLSIKGFTPGLVHTALLLFVLTPAAGLLAGMLNYDNLVFLLSGLLLYWTILVLNAKKLQPVLLVGIVCIAGVMTVVKWSSIAFVVPVVLYCLYDQISRFGRKTWRTFIASFSALTLPLKIVLILASLLAILAVIERPVANTLVYGKPAPSCKAVLGHERCLKNPDYYNYYQTDLHKDPNFKPLPLPAYIARYWVPYMADRAANLIEKGKESRLVGVTIFYLSGAITSFGVLLYHWQIVMRNKYFLLIVLVCFFYAAVLIIQEYVVYTTHGIPGAIRTRYLVPLVIPYLCLVLYFVRPLVKRFIVPAAVVAVLAFALLSQGGGIVTHLFTAPKHAYVSETAYNINQTFKHVLAWFIYTGK